MLFTVLTSIIVFTLLTTFLMSWYNYQYKSFIDNIESRPNWRQDNSISIKMNVDRENFEQYSNYFDLVVNETMEFLNEEAPGLVTSYTPVLTVEFMNYYNLSEEFYEYIELLGIGGEANSLLPQCLVEGRLPENANEILYLPGNSSEYNYALNDTIHLKVSEHYMAENQNFTVTGIIDNVVNIFYNAGFSSDIFSDYGYYSYYYYPDEGRETEYDDTFITTSQYLSQIITNYIFYQGNIEIQIDLDYQFSSSHIRNLDKLRQKLENFRFSIDDFQYIPNYVESFCNDLRFEIVMFQGDWLAKTVLVLASGIPLIFIFALICTETFHIGDHEKMSKFKLIKVHGLEFKVLRRMLFLENLLVSSIGLAAGFTLGTLFGYFFSLVMGTTNVGQYLSVLAEPVIIVSLLALFTTIFIVGFIIENSLAKKSAQTTAELYKRKRSKFIRKIVNTQEFIIFIPGVVLLAIGFMGTFFSNMFYELPPQVFQSIIVTCMFLMAIGALFVISSIFILFSRLIRLLWQGIGKLAWKKRKSYFTLSLKHLSIYTPNYTRSILAMFMICLAITPGFIVKKSVDDHVPLEANLTTGYADILVSGWEIENQQILGNISDIEGVELVTGVTEASLFDYSEYNRFEKGFRIDILNIHNVSEYLQIINQSILKNDPYSIEDIEQLENNMTYMMSKKYAKEKNYNRDEVFLSTKFTNPSLDPYEMIFVNSYEYFPLLRRQDSSFFSRFYDIYSLVVSNLTFSQLIPKISFTSDFWGSHKLLVKISDSANATEICNTIESLGSYSTLNKAILEQSMFTQIDDFFIVFFVIVAIIAMLALVFFGYITAKNIYTYRLRIIESEYQVGAQRKQIWGSFTIEFVLIILVPLLISAIANSLLLNNVLGFLLNVTQSYTKFNPWMPFWLIFLISILSLVLIVGGWIVEIIHRVNTYRPIKQE